MKQRTVRTGVALHARPLDRFVRQVRSIPGTVRLRYGEKEVDGRNVTQLLLLAVPKDAEVTVTVESPDEEAAVTALTSLLQQAGVAEQRLAREVESEFAAVVPGSPGSGVGRAHRPGRTSVNRPAASVEEEQLRLDRALAAARAATQRLIYREDPFSDIFEAQLTLIDDPSLAEALRVGLSAGRGAEQSLELVFADLAARFRALGSGFAAERHADLADVRERIEAAIGLGEVLAESGDRLILILTEATPSRLALLDTARVAAVISEQGGPTSHAAVVARGRGIPLVFAPPSALVNIVEGELLLVDGSQGRIQRATAAQAEGVISAASIEATPSVSPAGGACMRDGTSICLRANLGAPGDLTAALAAGAQGCGLLRSELLFARRAQAPSPEEQATAYARLARAMAPHPMVIRLFDAGSDKPLAYLPAPQHEPNPALGRRGVRLLLDHPRVLGEQLLAIAEARRQSSCDIKAMVPMVTDAGELETVHHFCPPELPLGSMVETPAAALLCRSLARTAAFLSVGSNDLAQYVTASDRLRGAAGIHPALFKLLAEIAVQATQAGIECSICGELAGDPLTAPVLVGLGYRCLSVAPAQLPLVRKILEASDLAELEELARGALTQTHGAALADYLKAQPQRAPAGEPS